MHFQRSSLAATSVLLMAALLAATGCADGFGSSSRLEAASLATRLTTGSRAVEDKARDVGRRPAAVVTFLGVVPGMTVLDVLASGGYYTEVLSEAVGPEGKVYAHNIAYTLQMRDGAADKAMTARLANGRLPNVERLDREFEDLGLAPGSIDVAITALNLHDIIDGSGAEAAQGVLRAIHNVLAPDGVLGVIDHHGIPGQDEANKKAHRIDEARVIAAVEQAGFRVDATSDVLRNPADDRTRFVFAPGLRGHTDRFVLRLRKAS